jgi:hypothetical protein
MMKIKKRTGWKEEPTMYTQQVPYIPTIEGSYYNDLKYYLQHGTTPDHLNAKQKRALRLKSLQYQLVHGILFRKNYDGVLLWCLKKQDVDKVLKDMHDGPVGGHFSGDTTTHKVLRVGYYWPTLFKYAHAYSRSCEACQKVAGREYKVVIPLQPIVVEEPFEQWGLDIIGEINPHSSKKHRYILTTTDYFTHWIEAIPLIKVNEEVVINFLEQYIITRFGVPNSLVFDNTTYFSSLKLSEFSLEKGIILKYSTNYYPQGNGLVESTNKNLIWILKRTIVDHQRNWHNALSNSLWDDRVTPKASIGTSPYFLVYGKEVILPSNIYLPSLQLTQQSRGRECPIIQRCINTLLNLEENHAKAKGKFETHQQTVKCWFDKKYLVRKNSKLGI